MSIQVETTDYGFVGRFSAMASPCECLIETNDRHLAQVITQIAAKEAWRIETKYSRYQTNNLCDKINQSQGNPVDIDEETFQLLNFAKTCYEISDGMFDLTSGVLRKVWQFNQSSQIPSQQSIDELLPRIGWPRVKFDQKSIVLEPNMEIDFGGIGKEYAVDRASQLIFESVPDISVVVNFGGDLRVTYPPKLKPVWQIGVNSFQLAIERSIVIGVGAVCTSGDTERFIIHQGQRYSHILNPRSGWPVEAAPKTVTVIADQCLQAGLLATLAMLQGGNAEEFLAAQNVKFFCQR